MKEGFKLTGLGNDIEKYVDFEKSQVRPSEVDLLIGDASKAKRELGWEPKIKFHDLIKLMLENDLKIENANN